MITTMTEVTLAVQPDTKETMDTLPMSDVAKATEAKESVPSPDAIDMGDSAKAEKPKDSTKTRAPKKGDRPSSKGAKSATKPGETTKPKKAKYSSSGKVLPANRSKGTVTSSGTPSTSGQSQKKRSKSSKPSTTASDGSKDTPEAKASDTDIQPGSGSVRSNNPVKTKDSTVRSSSKVRSNDKNVRSDGSVRSNGSTVRSNGSTVRSNDRSRSSGSEQSGKSAKRGRSVTRERSKPRTSEEATVVPPQAKKPAKGSGKVPIAVESLLPKMGQVSISGPTASDPDLMLDDVDTDEPSLKSAPAMSDDEEYLYLDLEPDPAIESDAHLNPDVTKSTSGRSLHSVGRVDSMCSTTSAGTTSWEDEMDDSRPTVRLDVKTVKNIEN